MSRTDAHTPQWVWQLNEPHRFPEHHDHTNGICDLELGEGANYRKSKNWWYGWGRPPVAKYRRCYLGWLTTVNMCGCRMCTDHDARIRCRRFERHDTKMRLHDAKKYQPSARGDIDPGPFQKPPW